MVARARRLVHYYTAHGFTASHNKLDRSTIKQVKKKVKNKKPSKKMSKTK